MLRSDAKFYQTWSHINLVTAGAKVLPLGIISSNVSALFTASSRLSQTLTPLNTQQSRLERRESSGSGSQEFHGTQNSWEAALVTSFWVKFVLLWCIFTNLVFEIRNVSSRNHRFENMTWVLQMLSSIMFKIRIYCKFYTGITKVSVPHRAAICEEYLHFFIEHISHPDILQFPIIILVSLISAPGRHAPTESLAWVSAPSSWIRKCKCWYSSKWAGQFMSINYSVLKHFPMIYNND